MARLVTSGFELNSKTSAVEFDGSSIPASITLATSPVNTGTYSSQFVTSSQASFITYTPFTSNQSTLVYIRTWLYITSATSVDNRILAIFNVTPNIRASIVLTTSNQLQLFNSTGVQVGSNSSTLSTTTWYCIELGADLSGTNGTITGRLNGNNFATGAGNASAGWSQVRIGPQTTSTTTLVFDDVAINDSTGSSQTSFPGTGQIARATPNAAGDSNGFATNVGGTAGAANNYTRVQEVTPDGTTTYNASNTLNASDFFAVGVTVPSGAVINAVVVGGQYANITTADATTAFKFQIKKVTAGTVSQSAAIIPNSTTMTVNKANSAGSVATYPLVMYTDPDGNPWTPTTVASMQIGYQLTATGTNSIGISDVWALVDYSLAPAVTVSDATSTSESITVQMERKLAVSDATSTSESLTTSGTLRVAVSDSTSASETVVVPSSVASIGVSDSVTINETITAAASGVLIAVSDSIQLSERLTIGSFFAPLEVVVTAGIQQINGVKIV